MRAFIALPLAQNITERLEGIQAELADCRPVPPGNLHLTLAFLDEQSDAMIEAVHDLLSGLRAAPFPIRLKGLETFGGRIPGGVLIHALPSEALGALHKAVRGKLHLAGLTLPRRRFMPHVTLARLDRHLPDDAHFRLAARLGALADVGTPEFEVREFALYRSTLGRGGAVHEILAEYPLI